MTPDLSYRSEGGTAREVCVKVPTETFVEASDKWSVPWSLPSQLLPRSRGRKQRPEKLPLEGWRLQPKETVVHLLAGTFPS